VLARPGRRHDAGEVLLGLLEILELELVVATRAERTYEGNHDFINNCLRMTVSFLIDSARNCAESPTCDVDDGGVKQRNRGAGHGLRDRSVRSHVL